MMPSELSENVLYDFIRNQLQMRFNDCQKKNKFVEIGRWPLSSGIHMCNEFTIENTEGLTSLTGSEAGSS